MSRSLLLDTNVLIALGDPTHRAFAWVESAIRAGARAMTCSVAWHEYVRGPLSETDRFRIMRILESRVVSLDCGMAEKAAELYNATGRRRGSTADCLIASAAMVQECELVSLNAEDFKPFVPLGLRMVEGL